MFRRCLVLVLLLLQLQPVLAFMPQPVVALAQQLSHEWVHQEGLGHRHDDALSRQSDDDGAALAHVHHDAAHQAVLLPANAALRFVVGVDGPPAAFGPFPIPSPCLDGPLRPPRSTL